MTAELSGLRAFVDALGMDETGAIRLAGKPAGRARSRDNAQRAEALTMCVYEHAYCQAFPPAEAPDAAPGDDLTEVIAAANTTRPRAETGWSLLESWADGSVIATRHGRTRRFAPGQFVPANGTLPAVPGTPLAIQLPAGSVTRQAGFYYCFSEGHRDVHDQSPLVRLYWNLTAAGAAAFVASLTGALNRYEIPFELKVTAAAAQFARRDNAVLYVAQDVFPAAALAIAAVLSALAPTLADGVPLFAKELATGIGLAGDPGDRESFGSARSKLVAAALVAAWDGAAFPWDGFVARFADAVAEAKLDIDRLWLNHGSKDIYAFPPLSPRKLAA